MNIEKLRNYHLGNSSVNQGDYSNNELIDLNVCKPLSELYKKGTKVGETWELLDTHLTLNPYQPYLNVFREFKKDYLEREHEWYMKGAEGQKLTIYPDMEGVKIWEFCSSKDGKGLINSNYGALVFGEENGSQFDYCLNKLKYDKNSREAMIIYTRPEIQWECQERGKHDFICTNYSHFFIRDNKLEMIHSQRSCDLWTGLPYDFAWSCFVFQVMHAELQTVYPDLKFGSIHYNIDSLHVYERSEKYFVESMKKLGHIEKDFIPYCDKD